ALTPPAPSPCSRDSLYYPDHPCASPSNPLPIFLQRLTGHLHSQGSPLRVINQYTAVHKVIFPTNIQICDTVKYKEIMKQYIFRTNSPHIC
uniref:Uncharacterized protein n=1 Tax=Castor canadensis TaxID=51338 RepID=A0A8C0ZSF6_CASCN